MKTLRYSLPHSRTIKRVLFECGPYDVRLLFSTKMYQWCCILLILLKTQEQLNCSVLLLCQWPSGDWLSPSRLPRFGLPIPRPKLRNSGLLGRCVATSIFVLLPLTTPCHESSPHRLLRIFKKKRLALTFFSSFKKSQINKGLGLELVFNVTFALLR